MDAAIINHAADLITAGDIGAYWDLRALHDGPALDGHDRRASLAQGLSLADLGPDPVWRDMTSLAKRPMTTEEYQAWRREQYRIVAADLRDFGRTPAKRYRKAG